MLTVISDQHFSDGSAVDNIPAEAIGIFLDDLYGLALKNAAKELVILMLGDAFDMLRSEYWLYPGPGSPLPPLDPTSHPPESFPAADRPWGAASLDEGTGALSAAGAARALQILERIGTTCGDHLALLRGELDRLSPEFRQRNQEMVARLDAARQALANRGVPIRRSYVPGNHDRLAYVDDGVWQLALGLLGVPPGVTRATSYRNAELALLARHGHESDAWNFEAYDAKRDLDTFTLADYCRCPVGDPIATELASRLPYAVFRALDGHPDEAVKATRDEVYRQMRGIADVRPLSAALPWAVLEGLRLPYPSPLREKVVAVLDDVLRPTMHAFMQLPFVQRWVKLHHKPLRLDNGKLLELLAALVARTKIGFLAKALDQRGRVQRLFTRTHGTTADVAKRDLGVGTATLRGHYCVYGHTHTFAHEPLSTDALGNEVVYINSGTFRPRVHQVDDRSGFIRFKEITWAVFYDKDEDPLQGGAAKGVSYETWSGLMLKRAR